MAEYYKLKHNVVEFLGEDSDLAKDVITCHLDNSYLADFFEKIDITMDELQGRNITVLWFKAKL